jgi:carboxyl-terminal processing protease
MHAWAFGFRAVLWSVALVGVLAAQEKVVPPKFTPDANDANIVANVSQMLEYAHFKQHKIDHEISKRMHRLYIESWDPKKLFFLKSDVEEFAQAELKHADFIKKSDFSFAIKVFNRYLERIVERNKWCQELANEKYDFTKPDRIVVDNKSTKYAENTEESKTRWRSWVKYELISLIVDGTKEEEARDRIRKRYRNLLRFTQQTDKDELLERYLTCLTSSFDPHSTYMSAKSQEQFEIDMRLQLQGIGALLGGEDGRTTIKEIIPGGAAERDKRLKVGDRITGVGQGDDGEIVDIDEMKITSVVRLIRGPAGSVVRLEVIPANSDKRVVYKLTRQKVVLSERAAKGETLEVPHPADAKKSYRVGVIKLPSFYADTDALRAGDPNAKSATSDVRKILDDFNKQGVDCVVMDLRANGGGLLAEAISVTGLFIPEGPVVQAKDFRGKVRQHFDDVPGVVYNGPLVVLVSKFSASASEIFAGAIQDYQRGLVVGDSSTHGKGSVQQIVELDQQGRGNRMVADLKLGAIKVTLQMFYRVNGDSTQNRGVVSDIVVPSATDREDFSESKLDYALEFDKIAPIQHANSQGVNPQLLGDLKKMVEERRAKSEDYTKLVKRMLKVKELADRKEIVFTEESLKKQKSERKELLEIEGDDDLDSTEKKKEKKFGEDLYDREVLQIVGSFVSLSDRLVSAR